MKVAIYVRLSDEDRMKKTVADESESIQNQKSMLINYCLERRWEIYNIYCDEDYSGADSNRPEWNRMIRDCEAGKIDIVLCKTQSRFSREMEIVERYIHNKFVEWGVRFIGMVDNADTDDARNKKARQINGLINEWYLEDLSDNIRRTLTHKKQNGEYTGSFAPYGYAVDPLDKNHLIVDPYAADIVREIFDLYVKGNGYISIAKTLNSRGVLNPSLYKRAMGSKFQTNNSQLTSKVWTDSTIYRIIRREVYIGHLVQGMRKKVSYKSKKTVKVPEGEWIRVENTHEPIINIETWNTVQQIIKTKHRQEKFTGHRHALSGKVYCAECGNKMWKMSYACSDGRYKYFKCKTVKNTTDLCSNFHSIRADNLSDYLVEEINKLIFKYVNPDSVPESEEEVQQISRMRIIASDKLEAENLLSTLEQKIQLLYKDRLQGLIAETIFDSFSRQLNKEYAEAQDKLKRVIKELSEIDRVPDMKRRESVLIKYTNYISEVTPNVAMDFIDRIYVGPLHELEDSRDIQIVWAI